jgi:hypothetical protein
MLRSLRSLLPFILASLGFVLIALTIKMPLFEWQVSEVTTDLPPQFHINPFWTTRPGESLEHDSYVLNQVVMLLKNGNSCSPEKLTYAVRRSQSDERLEQIAVSINQTITQWLTGLTFNGQITMAAILFLCGIYIWWFTIWYKRSMVEACIMTVVAVILLGFLINVSRVFVPEIGVFVCRPGPHGALAFNARLSKIHYETLFVLFVAIAAQLGALGIMLRQAIRSVMEIKPTSLEK